jgi:hypothetical protein
MMTPDSFCYWLKGFVELGEPVTLSKKQLQILKDHLDLVFDKKTPDRSNMTLTPFFLPSYDGLSAEFDAKKSFSMDQNSVSYTDTPLVSYSYTPISC